MRNSTKRRKQAAREAAANVKRDIALARLQQWIDEDNMQEMDRMADILGIERCSDYVERQLAKDRNSGLCSCQKQI